MTDTSVTQGHDVHSESHHVMYLKVWGTLAVFTVMELVYASLMQNSFLALVFGLMAMASIKAGLVAWYFMHLKFEGKWVYMWLIPAGFLVLVFITALYPDIGKQRSATPTNFDEEQAQAAPLEPAQAAALRA
jgi:cytochrome c oxidase subunit IV